MGTWRRLDLRERARDTHAGGADGLAARYGPYHTILLQRVNRIVREAMAPVSATSNLFDRRRREIKRLTMEMAEAIRKGAIRTKNNSTPGFLMFDGGSCQRSAG
jgi:hypothetical protein